MAGAMRALLRWAGTGLLFLLVVLCLAPSVAMPFLDRIYYEGPASDHFDGARFFNPGETGGGGHGGGPARFLNRWLGGDDERAAWPTQVPVTPSRPPARVAGSEMRVTWIGHATVLVQTEGLNILTDPVWSERASPFAFAGPKRVRAPGVRLAELPKIDLVVISHNHYDHLDLATLKALWDRDRPAIVSALGNDTILADRGIGSIAADWGGEVRVGAARVRVLRNHHWSARWGVDRNRALWSAFAITLPGGSLFFAGDTGWGDGAWVEEAARWGPYRLAILPIGAYAPRDFMKANHIDPNEAVAIHDRLRPARALGIHWGTFQLTFEPIDEPVQRLDALKRARHGGLDGFVTTEVGQTFAVPAL